MGCLECLLTRRGFSAGAVSFTVSPVLSAVRDPLSKEGTLFNVWKGATKDGPGIRTVVALKGCPLRCVWCHSPESWSYAIEKYPSGETVGWKTAPEKIVEEVLRDKPFFEASGGGITLSGGEALAQPDFCREILRLSKAAGIHTAIETSGYAPLKVIESVEAYIDLWLYDIKLLDPEKCFKYTRRPLKSVLENLRHLNAAKRRIVMRCPMIPGINDSEESVSRLYDIASQYSCVERVELLPFRRLCIEKYDQLGIEFPLRNTPEADSEMIKRLSEKNTKK